jgi:hypothetical protein
MHIQRYLYQDPLPRPPSTARSQTLIEGHLLSSLGFFSVASDVLYCVSSTLLCTEFKGLSDHNVVAFQTQQSK